MTDSAPRTFGTVHWLPVSFCAVVFSVAAAAGAQTIPPEGDNVGVNSATDDLQAQAAAALLDPLTGDGLVVWREGNRHLDFVWAVDQGYTVRAEGEGGDDHTDLGRDFLSVALGDVNGDLRPDAVFGVRSGTQGNRYCRGQGNGTFAECQPVGTFTRNSRDVALGHVDGVGHLDAVFASSRESFGGIQNELCFGDGSVGGFSGCTDLGNHEDESHGVALGDVDGDGHLDAVFANTGPCSCNNCPDFDVCWGERQNSFCSGDGEGGFSCVYFSATKYSFDVALGDLDGDGDLDAVFANGDFDGDGDNNRVCLWDGQFFTACSDLGDTRNSRGVALGDIDGDGDLDAVFANHAESNRACFNDGLGSFTNCSDVGTDADWSADVDLFVIDSGSQGILFTNDGEVEICFRNSSDGSFNCNDSDGDPPPGFPRGRAGAIADLGGRDAAIKGRGLNAVGPQGSDFDIFPTSQHPKEDPDVAGDFSGRGVAVWTRRHTNNVNSLISGRLLDAAGPSNGTFTIAGSSAGHSAGLIVEQPAVAMDASGAFVAVWHERTTVSAKIRARMYDAAASPLGAAFDVSSSDDPAARPAVAKDFASGNFLVVWRGQDTGTNGPSKILARLFDADGDPLTEVFQVEDFSFGEQANPAVAADLAGNFLVVWEGDAFGGREISGKRFGSDGGAVSSEFQVNTTTAGGQIAPAVGVGDVDGNFLVAWQRPTLGQQPEVRARWIAHDFQEPGITQVADFEVSTINNNGHAAPAVYGDLLGNFWVAWESADTIADTDGGIFAQRYLAPVMLQINDLSVSEGDPAESTATFTVQASKPHPLGAPVTVDYQTLDGSASFLEDYQIAAGTLTFDASGSALPVQVEIFEDRTFEDDETFFAVLDDPVNAVVARPSGLGTILNDDPPGELVIDDVSELEGDFPDPPAEFLFTVSLSAAQQVDASVSFATVDGTAIAGEDYEGTSGLLTIPAGATEGFLTVEVLGDTTIEADETFFVSLSDPSNASLSDEHGVGTILSDETCTQAPAIDPVSAQFSVAGGPGQVTVTDDASCDWTAVSNDPWITIQGSPGGPGGGTVDYDVAVNPDLFARAGTLTIASIEFLVNQDGTLCNFTVDPVAAGFLSAGGTGTIAVTATDESCPWTAQSDDPWIEIESSPDCPPESDPECVHGGTGDGEIVYLVAPNEGLDRSGTLTVAGLTVDVEQTGIFFDHFEDGIVNPEWLYTGGPWTEAGSVLTADVPSGETATAIARPAFVGCVECTIRAVWRFDAFSTGTAALYGWYLNDDNFVSLTADEFADTWTLVQRAAGVDEQSATYGDQTISVGQPYEIEISYDGSGFVVRLDGGALLAMPAAAAPVPDPDGTVGFRVEGTAASFDLIEVLTVTTGNLPATVTVDAPADGATLMAGANAFAGTAADPEDGDLSAALVWTSSLDGAIGTGASFVTDALSLGSHQITATVLDSGQLPAWRSIDVTVATSDEIFIDGFESGDLSAWSIQVP